MPCEHSPEKVSRLEDRPGPLLDPRDDPTAFEGHEEGAAGARRNRAAWPLALA
ncbi:MAG: hypothetical protein AAGJ96_05545 [Pseudomonadota bacterium]